MFYFVVVWSILALVCFGIGQTSLSYLKVDCFEDKGDRLIVSLWLGVVLLSVIFLFVALVVPLSFATCLVIITALTGIYLVSSQLRVQIASMSPLFLGWLMTLEFAVAFIMAKEILWFDTAYYHIGAIRWLAEYGTVPGVSLIHYRFGWISSWFALTAAFNPPFVNYRGAAMGNGFLLLIVLIHFFLSLNKILKREEKVTDWFVLIAYLLLLPFLLLEKLPLLGEKNLIHVLLVSASHDIPIGLIIVVTTWAMLIISEHKSSLSTKSALDSRLIPLILSAAAITIKLTSLGLFVVAFVFYVWRRTFFWQRILWGIFLSLLLVTPMIIAGIITSGCPILPSRFMCVDLPWSRYPPYSMQIGLWWKSIYLLGFSWEYDNYWLSILPIWFARNNTNKIIGSSGILGLILFVWLLKFKPNKLKGIGWVLAVGLIGMVFILTQAPDTRYGLGYFLVIPSFLIGSFCSVILESVKFDFFSWWNSQGLKKLTSNYTRLSSLFLATFILIISFKGMSQSRFLLPPALPQVEVLEKKVNDVEYFYPYRAGVCWASELPCSLGILSPSVRLRKPSEGLKGGFTR